MAGRWSVLTPEPLVKKTCVLPDSIVMLMSSRFNVVELDVDFFGDVLFFLEGGWGKGGGHLFVGTFLSAAIV